MIDHYRAQRMQDTVSSDILFCLIGSCISDFKARLVAIGRVGKFVHHLMQHEIYTHTHTHCPFLVCSNSPLRTELSWFLKIEHGPINLCEHVLPFVVFGTRTRVVTISEFGLQCQEQMQYRDY